MSKSIKKNKIFISPIEVYIFIIIICCVFAASHSYIVYGVAKSGMWNKDRVAHFPKVIPFRAKNVFLYNYKHPFFGSEGMLLEFDTNRKYIESELSKHKFIAVEEYTGKNKEDYHYHRYLYMLAGAHDFDIEDFTFYVINDREHTPGGKGFPYHYGIGRNKNYTKIIYYYDCPD